MNLEFLGHACFKLYSGQKSIIFDPYESGAFSGQVGYAPVDTGADIVLISHQHQDHNFWRAVSGNPIVIQKEGIYDMDWCRIEGIKSYHDMQKGKVRGENIVFVVEAEGKKVVHLGDEGVVDEDLINKLGKVDVLLIPVGGTFTLDSQMAYEFVKKMELVKVIVPMHYKTEKLGFAIDGVDGFLKLCSDREIMYAEDLVVDLDSILSQDREVVLVMRHSR